MKKTVIALVSVFIIALIFGFATGMLIGHAKNDSPYCVMNSTISAKEYINDEIRYEIVTEDGNAWVMYSTDEYNIKDNLLVVFYTFRDKDVRVWEILDFWRVMNGVDYSVTE